MAHGSRGHLADAGQEPKQIQCEVQRALKGTAILPTREHRWTNGRKIHCPPKLNIHC